jgi:hypothetical protein
VRPQRFRVGVDDSDQHFADDPPADGTETVAVLQRLGLLEDVEPQRRLCAPSSRREADLIGIEHGRPDRSRHRLPGWKPGRLPALQVGREAVIARYVTHGTRS